MAAEKSNEEKLKDDIEEIINDWYTGCPRPIKFVRSVIEAYKKYYRVKIQ